MEVKFLVIMFGIGAIPYLQAMVVIQADTVYGSSKSNSSSRCNKDMVFHKETERCYYPKGVKENSASPCGQLQFLYRESHDSEFGQCDCIRNDECYRTVEFNRPVLNWPGSGRCYYAYEQGPCKANEWLVINPKTFQSECKENPCRNVRVRDDAVLKNISAPPSNSTRNIDVFIFAKNGKCYQTFTQAYCPKDQYARFVKTQLFPTCFGKEQFVFSCYAPGVGTTAILPCPQGTKPVGSDCDPEASYD